MVINGSATVVGNQLDEIESVLQRTASLAGPPLSLQGTSIEVGQGMAPANGADVWLIRYDPNVVEVPVGRGENSGRTLPHTHVVFALQRLGSWTGQQANFTAPPEEPGRKTAILVQGLNGGPILSAITN